MNKNDNRSQLLHTLKVTFKILDWQYYKKKKKKKKVTEPFKIKLPAARASKGKKKFSMSIDANNFRRKHIFFVMSFSSSKFIFKITT